MAEIEIEKKKPLWPWIAAVVAILLIILIIFFLAGDDDDRQDDRIEEVEFRQRDRQENREFTYPENAVGQYLFFMEEEYRLATGEEGSRKAMEKLAAAVEQKARDLREDPGEELKEIGPDTATTTRITSQSSSDTTARAMTREEFQRKGTIIVNALEELQQMHFPELSEEIKALRADLNAAGAKDQEKRKPEAIEDFFEQAAEVLRSMPARTSGSTLERGRTSDTGRYSTDPDTLDLE